MIRKSELERWAKDQKKAAEGFINGAKQSLKEGTNEKKSVVRGRLYHGESLLGLIRDLEVTFKLNLRPKK